MRRHVDSLRILGPYRGGSGYDHHTRAFAREFVRQGFSVQLRELAGWGPALSCDLRDPFFETLSRPVQGGVEVQFAMPHQLAPTPGVPCVNYTMFECTRIPTEWVRQAERCAMVVVPTRSSYDAWVDSGVAPDRMRVVPLGIRRDLYDPLPEALPLTDDAGRPVDSYRVRFLNVAELCPRKNPLGLLRTWLRSTRPGDDAILLLKWNVWRGGMWELFRADLADLFHAERRTLEQAAPVLLLADYLADEYMPRLYRAATHYVSLSFGEGWDLPMTEAAAAGLSLVAPRHTAYLDYLDDGCVAWVPAHETAVDFEGRMMWADAEIFDGMRWWAPDEDAAVAGIREIIDGRAAPKWARERILDRYDWPVVTRQLAAVLADTEVEPARAPIGGGTRTASPWTRRGGHGMESYLGRAEAAAEKLTSDWFTAKLVDDWVPSQDYWKAPTIAQELVRHMALAGTTKFRERVDHVREAGRGFLSDCYYLDDATVWGRFHLTAFDWITATGGDGADDYRRDAITVFNGLTSTWDTTCRGGLYWQRPGMGDSARNFKATNATLGLMEIGLGLHRAGVDAGGLEWAQKAWRWIDDSGLIDVNGLVWGGLTSQCAPDADNVPVVALQGNPLTPLTWLYQATDDGDLLDVAQRIVDATLVDFVWRGTQTLKTPFDGDWAGQTCDWRRDHQNDATFKGVFCGFLGPFTAFLSTVPGREEAAAGYAAFLKANADVLTANFPGMVFGMDWHTPDAGYAGDTCNDAGICAVLQYSGFAALDAAAAVSVLPVPGD